MKCRKHLKKQNKTSQKELKIKEIRTKNIYERK